MGNLRLFRTKHAKMRLKFLCKSVGLYPYIMNPCNLNAEYLATYHVEASISMALSSAGRVESTSSHRATGQEARARIKSRRASSSLHCTHAALVLLNADHSRVAKIQCSSAEARQTSLEKNTGISELKEIL